MLERIGTCSLCGGDVMGYRGAYYSIVPPPPDSCLNCGAVAKSQLDIIEMVPRRWYSPTRTSSPESGPTTNMLDTASWQNIEGP